MSKDWSLTAALQDEESLAEVTITHRYTRRHGGVLFVLRGTGEVEITPMALGGRKFQTRPMVCTGRLGLEPIRDLVRTMAESRFGTLPDHQGILQLMGIVIDDESHVMTVEFRGIRLVQGFSSGSNAPTKPVPQVLQSLAERLGELRENGPYDESLECRLMEAPQG